MRFGPIGLKKRRMIGMVPSCGKTREVGMRSLIAGNWKMYRTGAALIEILAAAKSIAEERPACDVLICPPFTMIARAAIAAGGRLGIGGQDCHAQPCGAVTGDVSAEMLVDAGASAVIVGHSERRRCYGETDVDVSAKTSAAWRAGLLAILCVGETEEEHDAGIAPQIVARQ